MEVSDDLIKRTLEVYSSQSRMLLKADVAFPILSGEFLIGQTFYTSSPCEHVAAIEIQTCLNQLVYAGVAQTMQAGMLPQLIGYDFFDLQKDRMFITNTTITFRKKIEKEEDFCKKVYGEIVFGKIKEIGKNLFARASFDFESRSCVGNLELFVAKN